MLEKETNIKKATAINCLKDLDVKGFYPRGTISINNRWIVKDDIKLKKQYLTLDEVITKSSNIGSLLITNRLSAEEFYNGLKCYGFGNKNGQLPLLEQFKGKDDNGLNIYKSTISYGQAITATFNQTLNAYKEIFKDDSTFIYKALNNKAKELYKSEKDFKDVDVGIQLGTAQIARNGKYLKKYISSAFGFVSGKNKRYVIGVTVLNPISTEKYWYYYYASYSASPLFNAIVKKMIKYNYKN